MTTFSSFLVPKNNFLTEFTIFLREEFIGSLVVPLVPASTPIGNVNTGVRTNVNGNLELNMAGCFLMINETFCEQCSSGNFQNIVGNTAECLPCENNCSKCDSSLTVCSSCFVGYYLTGTPGS